MQKEKALLEFPLKTIWSLTGGRRGKDSSTDSNVHMHQGFTHQRERRQRRKWPTGTFLSNILNIRLDSSVIPLFFDIKSAWFEKPVVLSLLHRRSEYMKGVKSSAETKGLILNSRSESEKLCSNDNFKPITLHRSTSNLTAFCNVLCPFSTQFSS